MLNFVQQTGRPLGDIRKQSIYSTIFIYLGFLIGFISTGVLIPRYLSLSENGVIRLLASYSLIFAQLGSLGFPIATIRFMPRFRDKSTGHHGYFILLLVAGLTGFALFSLVYFYIKPMIIAREESKSSLFADYFFLILPLTFFEIFFNLIDGYARALFRATIGSFLKEFLQRLLVLGTLFLLIMNWIDFRSFVFLYIASLSVSTVILLILLFFQGEISLKPDRLMLKKEVLSGITVVSGFGLLTGMNAMAIAQMDTILINHFYDVAITGIYASTFVYGTLVMMPTRALFRIASTYISEAFNRNDIKTAQDIQHRSCLNQFIAGFILFLLLWLNLDHIFMILPDKFLPGKYVILLTGLGNLIHMASGLSSQLIINSPKYKYTALFGFIFLGILFIADIILIPAFGILGASWGLVFAILVFSTIKFIFLWKNFGIQPYDRQYLYIILLGLISFVAAKYTPTPDWWVVKMLIGSVILTVLFSLGIYYFRLSSDIRELVDRGLKWLLKK